MDPYQIAALVIGLPIAVGFVVSAWRRFHSGMDTVA
jgi:hypothetical protein